jgi:hypothetical protein
VESTADEEGLAFVLFDELHDAPGRGAVRFLVIAAIGGCPAQLAGSVTRCRAVFVRRRRALFERDPGAALGNVPGDSVLEQAVRDLAHTRREIALRLEVLGQEYNIAQELARPRAVVVDARGLRAPAAQQRRARRIAQRIIAVRMIEAHAAPGEPVDVRRLHDGIAVAADTVIEVVDGDQQYIEFSAPRLRQGSQRRCQRSPKQITSGQDHRRLWSQIIAGG